MSRTHLALLTALCFVTLGLGQAQSKGRGSKALNGKIILSTQPFPMSFASKKKMIKAVRKLHTVKLMYNEKGFVDVEFMGFFKKNQTSTEFTATIFDITEKRALVDNFPIYPSQKKTKVLASGMRFKRDTMEAQRNYHLTITKTLGSPVLAEVEFVILENPKFPKAEKAP